MSAPSDFTWFDYQLKAFHVYEQRKNRRLCLFFRTGAGKTLTALGCLLRDDIKLATVIAPPRTHKQWQTVAASVGVEVITISHEKFRQDNYDLPREALIVDEFHLMGGVKGKGWMKLRRVMDRRQHPMIVMSATPYWNSAERVFCAKRVVEGFGDYMQFLYSECLLEANKFSRMPTVLGFQRYQSAADWLEDRPWVVYLPDTRDIEINDVGYEGFESVELNMYGLDYRRDRIVASDMEERHVRKRFNLLTDDGLVRDSVLEVLTVLVGNSTTPVLLYCDSAVVAEALFYTLKKVLNTNVGVLTGATKAVAGDELLEQFRAGALDVLIGTATMRTGTDGLDKVCDTLIIVDDTTDDAARMQLVGRILPRGVSVPIDNKHVYRLVVE